MSTDDFPPPFDGAISRFLAEEATAAMRAAIAEGR